MNGTPAIRPLSSTPGTLELEEFLQLSPPAPSTLMLLGRQGASTSLTAAEPEHPQPPQNPLVGGPDPIAAGDNLAAELTAKDDDDAPRQVAAVEQNIVEQPTAGEAIASHAAPAKEEEAGKDPAPYGPSARTSADAACIAADTVTCYPAGDPMVLDGVAPDGEEGSAPPAVYMELLPVAPLVEESAPVQGGLMQGACIGAGAPGPCAGTLVPCGPGDCTPAAALTAVAMTPEPDVVVLAADGSLTGGPSTGTRAPAPTPLNFVGASQGLPHGMAGCCWCGGGDAAHVLLFRCDCSFPFCRSLMCVFPPTKELRVSLVSAVMRWRPSGLGGLGSVASGFLNASPNEYGENGWLCSASDAE